MQNIDTYSIKQSIDAYLAFMKAHPNGEEIQYRAPLENLFNSIKFPSYDISVIQEDRNSGIEVDGMPDFFVYKDENTLFKSLVGFIECKKPSYPLENLISSEQIKKYQKTCENIIITNYKEFILLQNGGQTGEKAALIDGDTLTIQNFVNLLQEFYSYDYQYIKTKKSLTAALANQSFYYSTALKEFIADKANETNVFYIKFNGLFNEYQKSINYHYELSDFCDIYAQSLVYGLMLVRLADSSKKLDEKSLEYLNGLPKDYKLLYEFLSQGYTNRDLPTKIKIALTKIGKNINFIDTQSIEKEFLNMGGGKSNIAVYLYEDFLSQYDKLKSEQKRKEGGVYYTPNEAADFITRGINDIIKSKFKLKDGYLSDNVKILDFASGTGTFLHSIFETILPKDADDLTKSKAKEKITKDIYGFELLFTPYIVSHTILTRFLTERGINLGDDRLGIYLTNTLDIEQRSISELLPILKQENDKAAKIKNEEDILAIVGNPPYFNGKSQSIKGRIDEYLQDYKRGLNEKKINLDDMYIKFIRFAEWKIEKAGHGIVGIITNNSYLDGITHRKMREHLSATFDEIYIVNLHGNSRKGETDKNIFDIMVGVSIVFFVKRKIDKKQDGGQPQGATLQRQNQIIGNQIVGANNHSPASCSSLLKAAPTPSLPNISPSPSFPNVSVGNPLSTQSASLLACLTRNLLVDANNHSPAVVRYFSTLDNGIITRNEKLDFLKNAKISNIKWKELKPQPPNFWFVEKDFSEITKYEKFWKLNDIFGNYNSGIQTKNDDFVLKYQKSHIETIVDDFQTLSISDIKSKYDLTDGVWTAKQARDSLSENNFDKNHIQQILYRPFDYRWTFLNQNSSGFLARPRYDVMRHFDNKENLGLCFTRTIDRDVFKNVLITDKIIDIHYCSDQVYTAPLYLYNSDMGIETKTPNWTKSFVSNYLSKLKFKPAPEDILSYIYAVLYSPIYRKKYIEFLKTDFPAIPMTQDKTIFYKYAKLGKKLIDLHLLRDLPDDKNIKIHFGNTDKGKRRANDYPPLQDANYDNFILSKINFLNGGLLLTTTDNKTITIKGVTADIYNFEIGSYKPIEKWLKYRIKDKVKLSAAKDLSHIKDMIISIKNTIDIQNKIETLSEQYLK